MGFPFDSEYHYKVKPIPNEYKRPLWSVLIPTFNCAEYLKETICSVLDQGIDEDLMEIIVVDDHSTKDNPEEIVSKFGKGRVKFIRQEVNVGKVKNYETGIKESRGYFIHQLHGDDKVRPGFYKELEILFNLYANIGAAFSRSFYIDEKSRWIGLTDIIQEEEGIVCNISELLYVQQIIQTPSIVVKREVYEKIGFFDRRLDCFEDWEMWNRISKKYQIATTSKVLAEYRVHKKNATYITFKNGSALKTQKFVFSIIDKYAEDDIKSNFKEFRNQNLANYFLIYYLKIGHEISLFQRVRFGFGIVKLHFTFKNLYHIIKNLNH